MKKPETDPLRVVFLGPLPPPYAGPEVMTQAMVAGLKQQDEINLKVLNIGVSRSNAEKGINRGRKSLVAFYQAAKLLHLLLSFKPEVVCLTVTNTPSFIGFLRDILFILPTLMLRKKLFFRFDGGYYFCVHYQGLKRTIVRSLLKRVSMLRVEGERLRSQFDGFVAPQRLVVILHGVDDQPFVEARKRRLSNRLPDDLKRILFVGNLRREKGVLDIIQAIPKVPEAQFLFVGQWIFEEEENEGRNLLRKNGVEDRAIFTGVVTGQDKYDLFASADVLVLPSYLVYEGQSVATVEALAAGIPIVCTDHGALNESVRDGYNGFFVPRSDPEALARTLNRLLRDDNLRRTMGERSRKLYEEHFTLERFGADWLKFLRLTARESEVCSTNE